MGGDFAKSFGNNNVMDPNEAKWGDMSGAEKGARVTGGVVNGLGKGLQSMQQQPRPQTGGGAPIQVAPTPAMPNNFDPNYLNAFYRR